MVGACALRVRGGGEARHRDRRAQLSRLHLDGRPVDSPSSFDARARVQRHERRGADIAHRARRVPRAGGRRRAVQETGYPEPPDGPSGDRRRGGRARAAHPDGLLHAAQPVGDVRRRVRQDEPGGRRVPHGQGDRRHEEVRRRPDRARPQVRPARQLRGRMAVVDPEHARGVQGAARVRSAAVPADSRRVQGVRREGQGGGKEVPRRLQAHHQGALPRRVLQDHTRQAFRRRT